MSARVHCELPLPVTPWPSLRVTPLAALLVLLGLLCSPAAAQKGFGIPGLAGGKARASVYSRVSGDVMRVAIAIEIDDGWHLYHEELGFVDGNKPVGKPTLVELAAEGVSFGRVAFPQPLKLDQPGLDTWIWGHEHELLLFAAGKLDGPAPAGVEVELDGLTCEDYGTCLPYHERLTSMGPGSDALFAQFPAALLAELESGAAAPVGPANGSAGTSTGGGVQSALQAGADRDWSAVTFPAFEPQTGDDDGDVRGLGMWLLLAFVAGMLLNVMPCVLPVISIKILSFVQQAGEDKRRVLSLGIAFAAGILVVFVALAALAAGASQSWGEQFQSPTFLVVMIGVVFAFALSLFGVFELGLPAGVGSLAGGPPKEGLGDAFFKGMLATVLATPCSGPFLGSTLTWTLSQPTLVIFAVFISLGLGMALPYVVLTANPGLLKLVPKPGAWMDTFKHSMGFVLLATVLYLMVSLRQDLLLFTLVFLLFVGLACWWYGRFAGWDKTRAMRTAHLLFALLLAALGARLAFVEMRNLFSADSHGWQQFDPDVFAAHLDAGDNVLLDFTADWCPNCKYNEKFVYDDEQVAAAMVQKGVVRMRADITHDSAYTDMLERLMAGLGTRSIPFLAIFPGDDPARPQVRFDIVTKGDVLGIVEGLP